jgi:pimeloyl-ACP methyl ester carboxylesterase
MASAFCIAVSLRTQRLHGHANRPDPNTPRIHRAGPLVSIANAMENPMSDPFNAHRRHFFGTAAATLAAAQLGLVASAHAQANEAVPAAGRSGVHTAFASIRQIDAGLLNVGYAELGPADGPVAILLHGWPYDIHSFVDAAPLLAAAGYRVIVPHLRGHGSTRFLSDSTVRNAQQSAVALDILALMDALKIERASIAGFDWGARTACIMAVLWPERCRSLVSVSGYLMTNLEAGQRPLPPKAEFDWWYQYYFTTARGAAGYAQYRREFAKLIWETASPKWRFDAATFERSAASLDNPDHVAVVLHNYRWRLSLAPGEAQYDAIEQRLSTAPAIGVPTITLEGDANGAPFLDPSKYRAKFSGKYAHRTLTGGIGHNLPQEAPQAFAQAVIDADRL